MVAGLTLAAVFLLIGMLPTVPRNRFVGVRTPWTLRSAQVWETTNRVARPVFLVAGLITLVVTVLAPDAGVWVGVALALLAAVGLSVYSWWLWANRSADD